MKTDEKHLYSFLLKQLDLPILHLTTRSTDPRTTSNPLFPINHTLAMMRDGISRLVRRTWAGSKVKQRLTLHMGIYVSWRNYVRRRFNRDGAEESPAMLVGLQPRALRMEELFGWAVQPWRLGHDWGLD